MEDDLNYKRLYLDDPIHPFYRNRKDVQLRISNSNLRTLKKERSAKELNLLTPKKSVLNRFKKKKPKAGIVNNATLNNRSQRAHNILLEEFKDANNNQDENNKTT